MRNTKQKNIILGIVNNSYAHLNAYQIYDIAKGEVPNISLGTVYRNLSNLSDEGKIKKIEVAGSFRFDKNIKHSHFVCNECGSVIDIFDSVVGENKYVDGNLVIDYEIIFEGICKKCLGGNDN